MEKYIVNGHEIEYDTFDLANMELYDSEVRRIEEEVRSLDPQSVAGDDYLRVLRGQAESILDFFDTLLGEGTAKAVFGGKVNVRDIFAAYRSFTQDVPKMLRDGFSGAAPSAALPVNREQRRAAEREKRREEARRKAEEKAGIAGNEAQSV